MKALVGAVIVVLLVIAGLIVHDELGARAPTFDTDYQAVLLAGGQVYYGRLHGMGSRFPVLEDVYYVGTRIDSTTQHSGNVLVRRGNEWHAPTRMYLNPAQVVLVEPVSPGSQVARLIAEQKRSK